MGIVREACRPAHYLKIHNLRYFSSPFDWMMNYEVSTISSFIANGFDDFFLNYSELPSRGHSRKIRDDLTGMVSMHDFPLDCSVEDYMPFFKKQMRHKYHSLLHILKTARMPGFISSGRSASALKEFGAFINNYFRVSCWILGIHNDDREYVEYEFVSSKPVNLIIHFHFNDTHPAGHTAANPAFWLGNEKIWKKIVGNIALW